MLTWNKWHKIQILIDKIIYRRFYRSVINDAPHQIYQTAGYDFPGESLLQAQASLIRQHRSFPASIPSSIAEDFFYTLKKMKTQKYLIKIRL